MNSARTRSEIDDNLSRMSSKGACSKIAEAVSQNKREEWENLLWQWPQCSISCLGRLSAVTAARESRDVEWSVGCKRERQ